MKNFIGAIIGDIIGSIYEFNNLRSKQFVLFSNEMFFTDDTVLTIASMDSLINKISPTKAMIKWSKKYPNCSWGNSYRHWINSATHEPYYSFGNGAAMRISPVGWFAKDENEVKKLSKELTEITHDHPEGLKGAEVTAMCVFYAKNGKSKEFIKNYVKQYYDIDFDYNLLKQTYFFNETCQNTVPQAIYCFLISKDFEDCIRTSVSIGGDTDTLCAISCAIASAYYGITQEFVNKTEKYLTKEIKDIINRFEKEICYAN